MPELPEVETIRRSIVGWIVGRKICAIDVRRADLRWPIPTALLQQKAIGNMIQGVERRGKYLLLVCATGRILLHFGMTGSLRRVKLDDPWQKHDHVALELGENLALRLHDPRRFGAVLWLEKTAWEKHPLLANLGVEPLEEDFHGEYLFTRSRHRRVSIKNFLMDARIVVGVGNIYANEALFLAGLDPLQPAGLLGREACQRLATTIRELLSAAIAQGGTTFRDFRDSDGRPGYFRMALCVYQKEGKPCIRCGTRIRMVRNGGRATFFCPGCQGSGGG
ncbi:MAG: bifunctional DNA-formamidopyrimidine glycosylase/DNA-(apurinic or apyrimidinic site) lyase [Magnetococcales bacterium]|nr:bifunctional DNA-formamidopyrimidine glycosylase/DNA-(apurinic or apyrimidinic site) lyase [Magnetococcales bacterium]